MTQASPYAYLVLSSALAVVWSVLYAARPDLRGKAPSANYEAQACRTQLDPHEDLSQEHILLDGRAAKKLVAQLRRPSGALGYVRGRSR